MSMGGGTEYNILQKSMELSVITQVKSWYVQTCCKHTHSLTKQFETHLLINEDAHCAYTIVMALKYLKFHGLW